MLPVKSLPASVAFYQKLGFSVERGNDEWRWAMLRFNECRLMIDESIQRGPGAAVRSVLYLYPDSITDYHQQVRAAGMVVPELEVTFYGMKEFRIEDPDGNQLWIGESVAQDG